eukprot:EG_transcript_8643
MGPPTPAGRPPLKRRLLLLLQRRLCALSRGFSLLALCGALLLPLTFSRKQFFDENALLGHHTPVTFSGAEALPLLRRHTEGLPPAELQRYVANTTRAWGLPTCVYDFHYRRHAFAPSEAGTNLVVTVHSQRGSRGEALLVVVPLEAVGPQTPAAHLNAALALALIRHVASVPWLAHDVVWLFAWPRSGAQHYAQLLLDGPTPPTPHEAVPSGVVRAALSLEVGRYHSVHRLRVAYEGLDGALPNADVLYTAHTLLAKEGFTPTHGHLPPVVDPPGGVFPLLHRAAATLKPGASAASAWRQALGLWRHLLVVASGVPGGQHAPFRQAGVHGVTLRDSPGADQDGVPATGEDEVEGTLMAVGRVVDGFLRSLNNLSEQLHASFFIYFVLSPEHFIAFDVVNGLVWLGVAGVVLNTLWLYHDDEARTRDGFGPQVTCGVAVAAYAFVFGAVVYAVPLVLEAAGHPPATQAAGFIVAWALGVAAFLLSHWRVAAVVAARCGPPAIPPGTAQRITRCAVQLVWAAYLTSLTVWNPALCLLAALHVALLAWLGTPAAAAAAAPS